MSVHDTASPEPVNNPARLHPLDFSVTQKALHWAMAFLILALLIAGQFFNDPDKTLAGRLWSREQHGSAGILIGLMLIARLILRYTHGVPVDQDSQSHWQSQIAGISHWGMYGLIAGLVTSGVAVGVYATDPLNLPILGGYNIAVIGNESDAVYQQVRQYHAWITDIAIGFIALHVCAALFHLFWIRGRVMQRMAFFWQSERTLNLLRNPAKHGEKHSERTGTEQ